MCIVWVYFFWGFSSLDAFTKRLNNYSATLPSLSWKPADFILRDAQESVHGILGSDPRTLFFKKYAQCRLPSSFRTSQMEIHYEYSNSKTIISVKPAINHIFARILILSLFLCRLSMGSLLKLQVRICTWYISTNT